MMAANEQHPSGSRRCLEGIDLGLRRPLVVAPMAGGPSTPQLCAAVAKAGGLPFLAAGYLTPAALAASIEALTQQTAVAYGINLFVPNPQDRLSDVQVYRRYRREIAATSQTGEAGLPAEPLWSDDAFAEKLDIALASSARFISFTFAYPTADVIERVHSSGKRVVMYATSRPGIAAIAASGADVIGIQGVEAGGHRATVSGIDDDSEELLIHLIDFALSISNKPIFAGGGVAGAADVLALLRAGATAVQVGTLFLNALEAGTKPTHRRALKELRDRETAVTCAFTGKPARAIINRFVREHTQSAPRLYPQLHYLTSALRKQADQQGNVENLNLWAGTGFRQTVEAPAANILAELLPYYPPAVEPIGAETPELKLLSVAVVGGGPRGLAVVERMVSLAADGAGPMVLDWFDDRIFGAGRVWDPYQTTSLLMNTVCSQLSAFPDPSAGFGEAYVHGPGFYAWIVGDESRLWLRRDPELLAERARTKPDTYTSRALYGAYLTWAAERIVHAANLKLQIRRLSGRVMSLVRDCAFSRLELDDGTQLDYAYVILAPGHLPVRATPKEQRRLAEAQTAGFLYIPTGDVSLRRAAKLAAKSRVLLLGLGLTFFDYLELLTTSRGGRYTRVNGELSYEPSGAEPRLYASSRRGVPYPARGVNEKAPDERWEPRFLTLGYIKQLRTLCKSRLVSFGRDVWPAIVREVEFAYTLAQLNKTRVAIPSVDLYKALMDGPQSYREFRQRAGLNVSGFPWEAVMEPRIGVENVQGLADYQQRVIAYLEHDIAQACLGNKSGALKAGLDVLRDIRNEVRQAVQGRIIADWSFYEELVSFYTPFNSFVSIGPPLYRVEQLSAILKAGIMILLPPDPFLSPDISTHTVAVTGRYFATEPVTVDAVVEARQPRTDALNTADILLRQLVDSGIAGIHRFEGNLGASGAISIDTQSFCVLDSAGIPDSRILLYGIPTEGLHWGTAATIRPFVNSVIFQEANAIARHVLRRPPDSRENFKRAEST